MASLPAEKQTMEATGTNYLLKSKRKLIEAGARLGGSASDDMVCVRERERARERVVCAWTGWLLERGAVCTAQRTECTSARRSDRHVGQPPVVFRLSRFLHLRSALE
jgi:hypothetical protein